MEAWGVRGRVLGAPNGDAGGDEPRHGRRATDDDDAAPRLGRAHMMATIMRERAALEYGDESDDAAAMRELEVQLGRSLRIGM